MLPIPTPIPGLAITSIKDLLTDEQRRQLHEDLAEMARLRRRAEAEAAWLPMP